MTSEHEAADSPPPPRPNATSSPTSVPWISTLSRSAWAPKSTTPPTWFARTIVLRSTRSGGEGQSQSALHAATSPGPSLSSRIESSTVIVPPSPAARPLPAPPPITLDRTVTTASLGAEMPGPVAPATRTASTCRLAPGASFTPPAPTDSPRTSEPLPAATVIAFTWTSAAERPRRRAPPGKLTAP